MLLSTFTVNKPCCDIALSFFFLVAYIDNWDTLPSSVLVQGFLDAIASPSTYPCQSVGQLVGH